MQTLQGHMLYCGGHIGMQDVLRSHSAEYGPPQHAGLIIEEQVSLSSTWKVQNYYDRHLLMYTSTATTATTHSGTRQCKLPPCITWDCAYNFSKVQYIFLQPNAGEELPHPVPIQEQGILPVRNHQLKHTICIYKLIHFLLQPNLGEELPYPIQEQDIVSWLTTSHTNKYTFSGVI